MSAVHERRLLSSLLPYDAASKARAELRSCMDEYGLLITAVKNMAAAVKNTDLEQFDAVVGENACQIRAVKVLVVASQCLAEIASLEEQVEISRQKMKALNIQRLMANGTSFATILSQENIDLRLSRDCMFLLQSYLLAQAKVVKESKPTEPLFRNDAADPKKLKDLKEQEARAVSSSFADLLVRRLRQWLSRASVEFVQEQARLHRDERAIHMVCEQDFVIEHKSWQCVPMFWTYKILLQTALQKGVPLIFHVKFVIRGQENHPVEEDGLFLEPIQNPGRISFRELDDRDPASKREALVVQGVSCAPDLATVQTMRSWKKYGIEHNVDIILAGAADHRQYPNPDEDARIIALRDPEYEKYKAMAKSEGYALENPARLFIQHVYATTVGVMISQLSKREE